MAIIIVSKKALSMIPVIRGWINRYFHNEECVLVIVLLALSILVLWTMGGDLGPVLVAIIVTFLMQGAVNWLCSKGMPHMLAVLIVWLLIVGFMVAVLLFLIPVIWQQLGALFKELPNMLSEGQRLLLLLPEQYPQFVNEAQIEQLIKHSGNELALLGQEVLSFSLENISILFLTLLYFVLVPLLVFSF